MTHTGDMITTAHLPCKVIQWPGDIPPGGVLHQTLELEIGHTIEHAQDSFWLDDTQLAPGDRVVCVPLCENVLVISDQDLFRDTFATTS